MTSRERHVVTWGAILAVAVLGVRLAAAGVGHAGRKLDVARQADVTIARARQVLDGAEQARRDRVRLDAWLREAAPMLLDADGTSVGEHLAELIGTWAALYGVTLETARAVGDVEDVGLRHGDVRIRVRGAEAAVAALLHRMETGERLITVRDVRLIGDDTGVTGDLTVRGWALEPGHAR